MVEAKTMPRIIAWEHLDLQQYEESNAHHDVEVSDEDMPIYNYPEPKIRFRNSLGMVDSKLYEFPIDSLNVWIGHTNFGIKKSDLQVICEVDGVEILECLTRYRMKVGIGRMFDTANTLSSIEAAMKVEKMAPKSSSSDVVAKIKYAASKVNNKFAFWFVYHNNGKSKTLGSEHMVEYKELLSVYTKKPGVVYTYRGETFEKVS